MAQLPTPEGVGVLPLCSALGRWDNIEIDKGTTERNNQSTTLDNYFSASCDYAFIALFLQVTTEYLPKISLLVCLVGNAGLSTVPRVQGKQLVIWTTQTKWDPWVDPSSNHSAGALVLVLMGVEAPVRCLHYRKEGGMEGMSSFSIVPVSKTFLFYISNFFWSSLPTSVAGKAGEIF